MNTIDTKIKTEEEEVKTNLENSKNSEYSAYYKSEDGLEVKKVFFITL